MARRLEHMLGRSAKYIAVLPPDVQWSQVCEQLDNHMNRSIGRIQPYTEDGVTVSLDPQDPSVWVQLGTDNDDAEEVHEEHQTIVELLESSDLLRDATCLLCSYSPMIGSNGRRTEFCSIHSRDEDSWSKLDQWKKMHSDEYRARLQERRIHLEALMQAPDPVSFTEEVYLESDEKVQVHFRFVGMV